MMKKMLIPVLAVAAVSATALPAAAQSYDRHAPSRGHGYEQNYGQNYGGWQSINQRKYNLDRRIDQGERNRQLSRREAVSLRAELNDLIRLEARYMRNGLSRQERADLDRRYDRLAAKVRYERRDYDGRRW